MICFGKFRRHYLKSMGRSSWKKGDYLIYCKDHHQNLGKFLAMKAPTHSMEYIQVLKWVDSNTLLDQYRPFTWGDIIIRPSRMNVMETGLASMHRGDIEFYLPGRDEFINGPIISHMCIAFPQWMAMHMHITETRNMVCISRRNKIVMLHANKVKL